MATISTPIGEQERAKREQAVAATIANLRIEDLHLDDESKRIFRKHVDGEIDDEEFRVVIDELTIRRFGLLSVSVTDVLGVLPCSKEPPVPTHPKTFITPEQYLEIERAAE